MFDCVRCALVVDPLYVLEVHPFAVYIHLGTSVLVAYEIEITQDTMLGQVGRLAAEEETELAVAHPREALDYAVHLAGGDTVDVTLSDERSVGHITLGPNIPQWEWSVG